MNLVRGKARPNAAGPVLETDDGLHLPLPADASLDDGQPILLGLRPEHLAISSEGLPCAVELTEPLGREILIYGRVGGSPICVAPGERPDVEPGARVTLTYDVKNACLFDAVTERSLRRGH
jgi:multiple sugar transport system ATP-binding protein